MLRLGLVLVLEFVVAAAYLSTTSFKGVIDFVFLNADNGRLGAFIRYTSFRGVGANIRGGGQRARKQSTPSAGRTETGSSDERAKVCM